MPSLALDAGEGCYSLLLYWFFQASPGSCQSLGPFTLCKRNPWSLPRHVPYHLRQAYGQGQLTSHDWSLFKSSTSNWHDLLYQLTVQIQTCFTNRYTFCFSNQLFMFCISPLIHSTTLGPTLSIGISPFFKCQAKKCKNPINLLVPLVGRPHVAVGF